MGRGARNQAIAATELLYGPRQSRVKHDLDKEIDQAVEAGDYHHLDYLLPKLSDQQKRHLRQKLAESAIKEEGEWGLRVLDAFGLRTSWADTIICENEHSDNRIYHLSHEAGQKLDTTLGAVDSPAVKTACGKEIGPVRIGQGIGGDGGRATRGSWQRYPEQRCPDCAPLADQFPEAEQTGDHLFDNFENEVARQIDLDSDDLYIDAIASYRSQFIERAVKQALSEGEKPLKRLYYGSYNEKRGKLDALLGRKMSDQLTESDWRQHLGTAVLYIDEKEELGYQPINEAADQLLRELPGRFN